MNGERREAYGDVRTSFMRIADLWSAYLGHQVTVSDVAHMMILMKVSRNAKNFKRDNLTDICGYARCAEMLLEGLAK